MQVWKKPDQPWGRYRQQYVYRCPRVSCRNQVVEPGWLPAATAIDWTLRGTRIGDRDRPLSGKTRRRIAAGIARYWSPLQLEAAGHTYDAADAKHPQYGDPNSYYRIWPTDQPLKTIHATGSKALAIPVEGRDGKSASPADLPLRTMTTRAETGLGRPFIAELRGGGSTARPADHPLATVTASGFHHGLVVPGAWTTDEISVGETPGGSCTAPPPPATRCWRRTTATATTAAPTDRPIGTLTTRDRYALVVRQNGTEGNLAWASTPVGETFRTLTTKGQQAVLTPGELAAADARVDDCEFRMLEPTETAAGMAFPPTTGGKAPAANGRSSPGTPSPHPPPATSSAAPSKPSPAKPPRPGLNPHGRPPVFPGPQTGPGTPEQHHGRLPRQPQGTAQRRERAPADTPAGRHHQPSQELPVTIISRRLPAAPETAADIEYGILANQLTMAIYPDLVFDPAPEASLIEARIADLAAIYPGLECSLMYRVEETPRGEKSAPTEPHAKSSPTDGGSASTGERGNRPTRGEHFEQTPQEGAMPDDTQTSDTQTAAAAPSGSARTGTARRSTSPAAPTLPTWTPSPTVPTRSAAGSTLPSAPTPTSARNAEPRSPTPCRRKPRIRGASPDPSSSPSAPSRRWKRR